MIKLGVIGYGRRIHGMINGFFRREEPDMQISAIVDPDEKGVLSRLDERDRDSVSFYPSLKELVLKGKPDALAIGTRCNLHAPYAAEAAGYDLPLFIEKPVAVSMEQAESLEKAFENSGCRTVVSFPLRVSPLCELVRGHIEDEAIGEPEHIHAFNYVPYGTVYFERPYSDYAVTQGLFLQKATHDFDYISFLFGLPVTRVAAMWTRGRVFGGDKPEGLKCSDCPEADDCPESPRNRLRNHSSIKPRDHTCVFGRDCGSPEGGMNEDSSSAVFEFPNGGHGIYTQVFFSRRDAASRGAVISGYRGTIKFDWYENSMKLVRHHGPFSYTAGAGEGLSHFGGDTELARDFIDIIKGKKKESRTPIWAGIQSCYACLAARESAETGKFADVRQLSSRK